jgi:hypothetical protein
VTWQNVKLLGFAPDLPPDTPGVFTASSGVVPTERGFSNTASPQILSDTFLDDAAQTGAVLTKVDGSQRIFGALSTKIYELVAGVPTTRLSGVTGGGWSFGQMGDASLVCSRTMGLYSSTTTTFSSVAGAPKASILVTPSLPQKQFAMLFDVDASGIGGDNLGDQVYWSAAADYTDWTPDVATECGANRVTDLGGPFTAATSYRDGILCWKARGMYLGTYVGGSGIWSFERISADIGCIGKNAVVLANDSVIWADAFGIWQYDGSYPHLLPGAVHSWWARNVIANNLATTAKDLVVLTWDKLRQRLFIGWRASSLAQSSYLVYNARSQLWTQHGTLNNSTGTAPVGVLLTPDYAMGSTTSRKFLSLTWDGGTTNPAGSITLGAIGSEGLMTTATGRIRPHWLARSSTTGVIGGTLWSGPTLPAVQTNTTTMVERTDGLGLDFDNTEDRYLQPALTFAAAKTWEIDRLAIDLAATDDGN